MASNQKDGDAMLKLRSSDGEDFQISANAAMQSSKIKELAEGNNVIPLAEVDSEALPTILEYLNKHAGENLSDEELEEFDQNLVAAKPVHVLFDLAEAAKYLKIIPLMHLVCRKVADAILGRTEEEVRQLFRKPKP